jgi:hypothetical protein
MKAEIFVRQPVKLIKPVVERDIYDNTFRIHLSLENSFQSKKLDGYFETDRPTNGDLLEVGYIINVYGEEYKIINHKNFILQGNKDNNLKLSAIDVEPINSEMDDDFEISRESLEYIWKSFEEVNHYISDLEKDVKLFREKNKDLRKRNEKLEKENEELERESYKKLRFW